MPGAKVTSSNIYSTNSSKPKDIHASIRYDKEKHQIIALCLYGPEFLPKSGVCRTPPQTCTNIQIQCIVFVALLSAFLHDVRSVMRSL